jgi:hypothetical protein
LGKLVVSTKGRQVSQNIEMRSEKEPVTNLPLVVLVNKGSASASEIFAGAMKDHKRGVLVGVKGQTTFGKGSVQTIEELKNSFEKDENGNYKPAAIRLTTARYYLPSGVSIDKEGVTPDIALELPKDFERNLLMNGLIGDPPPTETADEQTTRLVVTWKDGKLINEVRDTTGTLETDNEVSTNPETLDATTTNTASADSVTTAPKPRRIIPLVNAIAGPDAEPEATTPRRPEISRRRPGQSFIDYQLEVARCILVDHIKTGEPMTDPDVGRFVLTAPQNSSATTVK